MIIYIILIMHNTADTNHGDCSSFDALFYWNNAQSEGAELIELSIQWLNNLAAYLPDLPIFIVGLLW